MRRAPSTRSFSTALGRKLYDIYPSDQSNASRLAAYWYDEAGNLIMYKNPTEQYRHFFLRRAQPATPFLVEQQRRPGYRNHYDNASRMTDITTNNGETVVAFYYDEANRKNMGRPNRGGLIDPVGLYRRGTRTAIGPSCNRAATTSLMSIPSAIS